MHIHVVATVCRGMLELTIVDDGRGAKIDGGTGIGLQVTKKRLSIAYGKEFCSDAGPRPEGGYEVDLCLPLERLSSLSELLTDHRELERVAGMLFAIVRSETPPIGNELNDLRDQMRAILTHHSKAETGFLYPRLRTSKEMGIIHTTQMFQGELTADRKLSEL